MFKSKIIKVDTFTSKAGKPCAIAWYASPCGLPCKNFVDSNGGFSAGDEISVSIEPGFDCTGRIVIKKA